MEQRAFLVGTETRHKATDRTECTPSIKMQSKSIDLDAAQGLFHIRQDRDSDQFLQLADNSCKHKNMRKTPTRTIAPNGLCSCPGHSTETPDGLYVAWSLLRCILGTRSISRTRTSFSLNLSGLHSFFLLFLYFICCLPQASGQIRDVLQYQLLEESLSQSFIGNVTRDANLPSIYTKQEIKEFRFSLSGQNDRDFFSIDSPYGILRTTKVLDRDSICAVQGECTLSVNIIIQPTDYFRIIKVQVLLMDRNDHQPIFPDDTIRQSVAETMAVGAAFPLPLAEDADSVQYNVRRYVLETSTDFFSLRTTNSSGTITDLHLILEKALDRETQVVHRMKVAALDGGSPPQVGYLWVEIIVADVNDNNPSFEKLEYETNVNEDTRMGTIILTVRAHDPDANLNGKLVYALTESSAESLGHMFFIDSETGDIQLTYPLDYEQTKSYQFSVTARDQGLNSLPAYAKVVVWVKDVNDHAPEILLNSLSQSGHAEVLEGAEIGTFVSHLTVSDPDEGINGQASCRTDDKDFTLEALNDLHSEFAIKTARVFDRETQPLYNVELTCEDMGVPPMSMIDLIPITILDANDHEPEFFQNIYVADLPENNLIGQVIARVNASDEDIGKNGAIKYEFITTGAKQSLVLDPLSGVIRTSVSFDYEHQSHYEYLIIAYDQGIPSLTATTTLKLNILDANDMTPVFLNASYLFSVPEHLPSKTHVGVLKARDSDSDAYNKISFSWDQSLAREIPFELDEESGAILTSTELDREDQSQYQLTAVAENKGYPDRRSWVQVTISILDINDNPPLIQFPNDFNDTVQVWIGRRIGHKVTKVVASDPDDEANGRLTYSILNNNSTFVIEPDTGEVVVASDLHDTHNDVSLLVIKVTDNGNPTLSATADLNIVFTKYLPSSADDSSDYFIIIILVIVVFVFIVVLVCGIIFTMRRRSNKREKMKYHKAQNSHQGPMGNGQARGPKGTDDSELSLAVTTDGCKPRKEVKFIVDMKPIGESCTDEGEESMAWSNGMDNAAMIQNHRSYPNGQNESSVNPSHNESDNDEGVDKLGPLWMESWGSPAGCTDNNMSNTPIRAHSTPHGHHGAYHGHHMSPSSATSSMKPSARAMQHSPVSQLTEMELEMHEMLHIIGKDRDSETGSVTDSGRGPSEEGDTQRPSPLDPKMAEDAKHMKSANHVGPHVVVGLNPSADRHSNHACSSDQRLYPPSSRRLPSTLPHGTSKNFHGLHQKHRPPESSMGNGASCPLKPIRSSSLRSPPSYNQHQSGINHNCHPGTLPHNHNLSSDSSDSAVSALSWADSTYHTLNHHDPVSNMSSESTDKRTVTFEDELWKEGSKSLDRPVSKGPMAKFGYNNKSTVPKSSHQLVVSDHPRHISPAKQNQNISYSNHDRDLNGNQSISSSSGFSNQSDSFDSNTGDMNSQPRLRGILKNNLDEPIRQCINENLYSLPTRSASFRHTPLDAISDDGTVTTTSGSYILDTDEIHKESTPIKDSENNVGVGFSI